jgi:hypothetical protein
MSDLIPAFAGMMGWVHQDFSENPPRFITRCTDHPFANKLDDDGHDPFDLPGLATLKLPRSPVIFIGGEFFMDRGLAYWVCRPRCLIASAQMLTSNCNQRGN